MPRGAIPLLVSQLSCDLSHFMNCGAIWAHTNSTLLARMLKERALFTYEMAHSQKLPNQPDGPTLI